MLAVIPANMSCGTLLSDVNFIYHMVMSYLFVVNLGV